MSAKKNRSQRPIGVLETFAARGPNPEAAVKACGQAIKSFLASYQDDPIRPQVRNTALSVIELSRESSQGAYEYEAVALVFLLEWPRKSQAARDQRSKAE